MPQKEAWTFVHDDAVGDWRLVIADLTGDILHETHIENSETFLEKLDVCFP